jgi:hypothetical protein
MSELMSKRIYILVFIRNNRKAFAVLAKEDLLCRQPGQSDRRSKFQKYPRRHVKQPAVNRDTLVAGTRHCVSCHPAHVRHAQTHRPTREGDLRQRPAECY